MSRFRVLAGVLLLACSALLAEPAFSAETGARLALWAGVVDATGKSRRSFDGKALMTNLLMLQAQGEAKFHPVYSPLARIPSA